MESSMAQLLENVASNWLAELLVIATLGVAGIAWRRLKEHRKGTARGSRTWKIPPPTTNRREYSILLVDDERPPNVDHLERKD